MCIGHQWVMNPWNVGWMDGSPLPLVTLLGPSLCVSLCLCLSVSVFRSPSLPQVLFSSLSQTVCVRCSLCLYLMLCLSVCPSIRLSTCLSNALSVRRRETDDA